MEFSFFNKSKEDSPTTPTGLRHSRKWIVWILFIAFWVLYYWWR